MHHIYDTHTYDECVQSTCLLVCMCVFVCVTAYTLSFSIKFEMKTGHFNKIIKKNKITSTVRFILCSVYYHGHCATRFFYFAVVVAYHCPSA